MKAACCVPVLAAQSLPGRSYGPRGPRRAGTKAVGFVVADELFLRRVELQLAIEQPGQRGSVAGDVRVPHDLRVGRRLLRDLMQSKKLRAWRGDIEPDRRAWSAPL